MHGTAFVLMCRRLVCAGQMLCQAAANSLCQYRIEVHIDAQCMAAAAEDDAA